MKVSFNLNGAPVELDLDPAMPLLWALREGLDRTGTKFGCGVAACGACTVMLDGQAVRSCVIPVQAVAGRDVLTIELLRDAASHESARNVLAALQAAWIAEQVPQCGYCQSGMLMAATALLLKAPVPDDGQIDDAMTNLCRCGTYQRIRRAIHRASQALQKVSA